MPLPALRFTIVAAFCAATPAAAQFSVQGGGLIAALDGGSYSTGLAGGGVEAMALFRTFLVDLAAGIQFVDYGRVGVLGLIIEPRFLIPDTERIKPYVSLRYVGGRYSYAHQLGDATGKGFTTSVGFGATLGVSRRVGIDAAYHYLLRSSFSSARVGGTRVDDSPIEGHGGGLQLRLVASVKLGKR